MSFFRPIAHLDTWRMEFYKWLCGRATAIYALDPLPDHIDSYENEFWVRMQEVKAKKQKQKENLNYEN